MNRSSLSKATSVEEGQIPSYLVQEIYESTKVSEADGRRVAEYLVRRLQKSNLNTKLKALYIIHECVLHGSIQFLEALRGYIADIEVYLDYNGPLDPVSGEEKYRQIREMANNINKILIGENSSHVTEILYDHNIQNRGTSDRNRPLFEENDHPAVPTRNHGQIQINHNTHGFTGPTSSNHNKDLEPRNQLGTSGVWGSSGFQSQTRTNIYPRESTNPSFPAISGRPYNPRDNRPTVLVGHQHNTSWKSKMSSKLAEKKSEYTNRSGATSETAHHGKKIDKIAQKVSKATKGALDMWERRGLDKSITSSLADHDDYMKNSAFAMENSAYQPREATGGGDDSGEYERGLVENLCAPGGLSRTPPPDLLERFLELAQTLDVDIIGTLLLENVSNGSWPVQHKALCVMLSLLEAPGCWHYAKWLEDELQLLKNTQSCSKSCIRSKGLQVLNKLGVTLSYDAQSPQSHNGTSNDLIDILNIDSLNMDQTQPPSGMNYDLKSSDGKKSTPGPVGFDSHELLGFQESPNTRSLSNIGKDLLVQATSPQNSKASSAFNFL